MRSKLEGHNGTGGDVRHMLGKVRCAQVPNDQCKGVMLVASILAITLSASTSFISCADATLLFMLQLIVVMAGMIRRVSPF